MEKELRLLLDRYLDGLTTLEEEAWLADYFRTNEVGEELMPFKEMFGVIEEDIMKMSGPTPALPGWGGRMVTPVVPRRARIVLRVVSWGAAVAAIVLLVFVLSQGNDEGQTRLAQMVEPVVVEEIEADKNEESLGNLQDLQNLKEDNSNVHKVKRIKRIAQTIAENEGIEIAEEELPRERSPRSGHDDNLMADAHIMMDVQLQMIELQRLNNYDDEDEDNYLSADF